MNTKSTIIIIVTKATYFVYKKFFIFILFWGWHFLKRLAELRKLEYFHLIEVVRQTEKVFFSRLEAMNPLITSNSQALLSRSNTTQLQLPLHVGSKTTLQSSEFKQNGPELRRCSLSSPCLFPTDENSLPSSMDLRTSGGNFFKIIRWIR